MISLRQAAARALAEDDSQQFAAELRRVLGDYCPAVIDIDLMEARADGLLLYWCPPWRALRAVDGQRFSGPIRSLADLGAFLRHDERRF